MAVTRRSGRGGDDPPPPSSPPPPPPKAPKKRGRGKPKAEAEEDADIGEQRAFDGDDVTMTVVEQVTSGKHRPYAGKNKLDSKSAATSKRKLDVSESEGEVASETPTGDIHVDDDEQMSELSSLDEREPTPVELTPKPRSKPPKKKAREATPSDTLDTPVKTGSRGMVNATRHFSASKGKPPVGGPAPSAIPTFDMDGVDLAAWMDDQSEAKATKTTATATSRPQAAVRGSSSKPYSVVLSTPVKSAHTKSSNTSSSLSSKEVARAGRSGNAQAPRTKAVPPPALAKPPKPSQTKPFQPDDSTVVGKTKGKQRAARKVVVESDDEEPERAAALSSPPKGGARPTSMHFVKIKEEHASPKLNINVVEPTPRKNDQKMSHQAVDKKENRGRKEKQKAIPQAESDDSSVEIVEDPRQTLKVPRSQNASRSWSQSTSRGGKTWRLEDLPEAARELWRTRVVPALLGFQGTRLSPWFFNDAESIRAIQQIWNVVYGDRVPHQVIHGDCVHGLACQYLSNWRSAIRAACELVVGTYFQDNELTRTREGRAKFSGKILQDKRYLYENPFDNDNKRLFRSNFFLVVLAWHLEATKNAVNVPGLFDGKTIRNDRPVGVFGLVGAGLERIFKLFHGDLMRPPVQTDKKSLNGLWRVVHLPNPKTGTTCASHAKFTTSLFSRRTTYFIDCANQMSLNRFNGVIAAAQQYMGLKLLDSTLLATEEDESKDREEELLVDGGDSD